MSNLPRIFVQLHLPTKGTPSLPSWLPGFLFSWSCFTASFWALTFRRILPDSQTNILSYGRLRMHGNRHAAPGILIPFRSCFSFFFLFCFYFCIGFWPSFPSFSSQSRSLISLLLHRFCLGLPGPV